MENLTIILVVLAATWGGMFNVMKIVEMKNGIRNLVLEIPSVDQPLSREKKGVLLWCDYVPLSFGIWFFLTVFIFGVAVIPTVLKERQSTLPPEKQFTISIWEQWVCYGAASFAGFAMLLDIVASICEFFKMRKAIKTKKGLLE